jgi:hypothetical protein
MENIREWPQGFWERLRALSEDLPDDFDVPDPLPDAPHRDRVIDEWIASTYQDDGKQHVAIDE